MTNFIQHDVNDPVLQKQIDALAVLAGRLASAIGFHAIKLVDELIKGSLEQNCEKIILMGDAARSSLKAKLTRLKEELTVPMKKACLDDVTWPHKLAAVDCLYLEEQVDIDGYLLDHSRILNDFLAPFVNEFELNKLYYNGFYAVTEAQGPIKELVELYLREVTCLIDARKQALIDKAQKTKQSAIELWNRA